MLKIEQAFLSSFIAGNFGLPIAHKNKGYTPVLGTPYVELTVAQNDETAYSVSTTNETDGVYRAILYYPENDDRGQFPAMEKAEEIRAHFPIESKINYDGVNVIIKSFQSAEGVPVDGWYKIVVTMNYKSYLGR